MKSLLTFTCFFIFISNSFSQSELTLSNCNDLIFVIDDTSDPDGDGNICETNLMLQNIAMYSSSEGCLINTIKWNIYIDLDSDGAYDVEYSSELPNSDTDLDDTNMNGIPDLYIETTEVGQAQLIIIEDVEGPNTGINILWQVEDQCGVQSQCLQNIYVEDKKAPAAICSSVSTYVFDGFETDIFARDYNFGAFDNCTDIEDIRFSFSEDPADSIRIVNCEDVLNSPVELAIYFFDDNDNVDFCIMFLNVIPTETVDCYPHEKVQGYVKTEKDEPMEGVAVYLNCSYLECPRVTETDEDGFYSFHVYDDLEYPLSLTADFEGDYLYRVSTLDLVKIMRHILGVKPFENPYQYIAGDLNNDEAVKASDLVQLRKLILGVVTELPFNSSWKFVNENFNFPDYPLPIVPLTGPGSDPFSIDVDASFDGHYNFIGVKIGNIEG